MRRRRLLNYVLLTVLICIVFICAGCKKSNATDTSEKILKNEPSKMTKSVFAMDTIMNLTVYGDEECLEIADKLIKTLEKELSVTDSDSDIYKLNHGLSEDICEDTAELITSALDMCEKTGGVLDITVFPIVKEWGFTTGENHIPDNDRLTELLRYVDYSKLQLVNEENNRKLLLEDNMNIDLGSVAKGYTGDRILKCFSDYGIESAVISLGGNVQVLGAKPDGSDWKVAIADPKESNTNLLYVLVKDKAVITSGDYQRYFEKDGKRYHHIIDPETGKPADSGLKSVTIIGDKGVECDALSTALFIMGLEKCTEFWKENGDFEAIIIDMEGNIFITEGLEGKYSLLKDAKVSIIRK